MATSNPKGIIASIEGSILILCKYILVKKDKIWSEIAKGFDVAGFIHLSHKFIEYRRWTLYPEYVFKIVCFY